MADLTTMSHNFTSCALTRHMFMPVPWVHVSMNTAAQPSSDLLKCIYQNRHEDACPAALQISLTVPVLVA